MACAVTTTINTRTEDILPLADAARRCVPLRSNGRRPSYQSVWRWATKGLRGVKLETVSVGGTLYMSRDALERFYTRLNDARNGITPAAPGVDHDHDDAMLASEGL